MATYAVELKSKSRNELKKIAQDFFGAAGVPTSWIATAKKADLLHALITQTPPGSPEPVVTVAPPGRTVHESLAKLEALARDEGPEAVVRALRSADDAAKLEAYRESHAAALPDETEALDEAITETLADDLPDTLSDSPADEPDGELAAILALLGEAARETVAKALADARSEGEAEALETLSEDAPVEPPRGPAPALSTEAAVPATGIPDYSKPRPVQKVRDLPGPPSKADVKKALASEWALADLTIRHHDRTLLHGRPGTGKTTAGFKAATFLKERAAAVTLSDGTASQELRGHFIPVGATFYWMDGPALDLFRHGGVLILNELSETNHDVEVFLYCILDDPEVAEVTLPTGEKVRRHPNFRVVGTMNGDPSMLKEALADRFLSIRIDLPHPDAIARLPKDLQKAARSSTATTDSNRYIGLRQWIAYAEMREAFGGHDEACKLAARVVFGKRSKEVLDAVSLATS